jgi:hypothetical protein
MCRLARNLTATVGGTSANAAWKTALVDMISSSGVYATVGGTTTPKSGDAVVENWVGSESSSRFNFGVSGIGGTGPPKTGGYTSPFKGSLTFGVADANKQGIAYSVIGAGTIELTNPAADQTAVAKVKRTTDGVRHWDLCTD